MPLYEYHCPTCGHKFDKLQPMNAAGADCPNCEQPARRAISVFASLSGRESGDTASGPLPPMGGGGCCGGGSCGCGH
jgi:putative FmdB family regulatory protein